MGQQEPSRVERSLVLPMKMSIPRVLMRIVRYGQPGRWSHPNRGIPSPGRGGNRPGHRRKPRASAYRSTLSGCYRRDLSLTAKHGQPTSLTALRSLPASAPAAALKVSGIIAVMCYFSKCLINQTMQHQRKLDNTRLLTRVRGEQGEVGQPHRLSLSQPAGAPTTAGRCKERGAGGAEMKRGES
jgi:hypothetical protein